MPGETIADFVDVVMGQSPPGSAVSGDIGIPLLNGPTEFGQYHPTPVQFTTDARKFANPGDLLFCVRGSTTGRMNWADQKYAIGRGIAAFRHRWADELQPFVRAVIEFQLPALLAQATGSTFPSVSASQLAAIPYPNFSEVEQRRIAHILGTLDDKIELNRQMNETLEAIARTIFKSWFVDFDPVRAKMGGRLPAGMDAATATLFPSAFQDSLLGKIPKGWEVATVGEEFNLTMGQSPPGSTYNEEGKGLPFYQGRKDFGFRYPTRRVYCNAPTRVAKKDDTLVSVRAPVGDINMVEEKCCIGRGVAAILHKTGSRSYTYYAMQFLKEDFSLYEAEGTVFGAINKTSFQTLSQLKPSDGIIEALERLVYPLDQSIENNENQSRTLSQIRDALLPKLLSGEIRVADVDKRLEEKDDGTS